MRVIVLVDEYDVTQHQIPIEDITIGTYTLQVIHDRSWKINSSKCVEIVLKERQLEVGAGGVFPCTITLAPNEVVGIIISHFRRPHGGRGVNSAFASVQYNRQKLDVVPNLVDYYFQGEWCVLSPNNPRVCLAAAPDSGVISNIIQDFRTSNTGNLQQLEQHL